MEDDTFTLQEMPSYQIKELIRLTPDMQLTIDLKELFKLAKENGWLDKDFKVNVGRVE